MKTRFDFKISLKKRFLEIGLFFKSNLVKLLSVFVLSFVSILLTSFGVYSSSKSRLDSVALSAANIAKDNNYPLGSVKRFLMSGLPLLHNEIKNSYPLIYDMYRKSKMAV